MNITYPTGIGSQPDQELLRSASEVLAQVLGPQSSNLVDAQWSCVKDNRGRTIFRLSLHDSITNESVATDFAPDELKNPLHLNVRMYRLWGDLLQVRNDRQHERVRAMSAQVVAE